MLTGRYQCWGFFSTLMRVAASLIETLKFNLLASITVDAWTQTQRKMLIEFRGSELWHHQRVNSVSSRRKQIFLLPAGSFTDCISAWFDVFTYSSRWRGAASFSDSRLQQLPSSCCWTRGADPIKNAWEQARLFCAKYSCTHAACLVVSMRSWCDSLSREGIEVDAAFLLCSKGSSKNNDFKKDQQWLCTFQPIYYKSWMLSLILHRRNQV